MKHLLQHFKTLTKHPQNAEELKGLILQLAIQGKLTENWRACHPELLSGSNSASKLLERIKEEKEVLIAQKKIKKEKPLDPIPKEDAPFERPSNWEWIRLGDLMAMYNGRAFKKHEWSTEGIPIIRIQNLNKKDAPFNYFEGELLDKHKINKGTFLISWSGTPGTSFGAFIWDGIDGALNQHINKCVFHYEGINKEFFKKAINSRLYRLIEQAQGGVGLKHVTKGILNNLILPLPPLEEQKAIVAIVNELFAEVEQLEDATKTSSQLKEYFVTSALQRLAQADNVNEEWQFLQSHFTEFFTEKENVKQLRETLLQLAVQGKLTAKWRSRHPELIEGQNHASELLNRIQTEKQQLIAKKKIKKEKPLPLIEDNEKPYDLPKGWVWCRFQDCANIASNLVKPHLYLDLPHIAPDVIEKGNGKLLDYRTIREDAVKSSKHYFFAGQIIYSKIRPNLNKLVEVDFEGLCSADMYPIDSFVYRSYLFTYMLSKVFLKQSVKSDTRVAMPKINQAELSMIVVPVPPLEEQKTIVEKVNSLMALCDSLEEHIDNSQTQIEQLMQSCLREVFEMN
ncbi:restriction endonuclease subunit S [Mangrovimonas sp. AS39]|uniref:restriction endonuclease subunit S n=1 Tax=Mangrovimonas futianensis TaxID=2895523 RepID=UPI001E653F64|nr:restriction endonuclease subunit S [Mangrovimonas futianensis]MCF1192499.1 restriction endonuclease subunit S [Mangrovimonas futianensis]MCF1196171.1 restriction endonuclease subunit S [Mangrovimonas futianensis]